MMAPKSFPSLTKWQTVGGAFLLMLPIGLPWYWGNMAVYAMSYVAARAQSKADVDVPWIISVYFLTNFVGLFVAGILRRGIPQRLILVLGVLFYVCGIFLTYLTIKVSVVMLTVSLGIVSGLGGGIINGIALHYAVPWAGQDLGLVTSVVQSGFACGPIFINPFVTFYLNPDNLSPNIQIGSIQFFSQSELIDRVPSFFLLFGLVCFTIQLVGFACVRDVPKENPEEVEIIRSETLCNGDRYLPGVHQQEPSRDTGDKSPKEVLKTKDFYILAFLLMLFDNAMLVLANYYKDYGAVWIHDDYFLTFLGNIFTVAIIIGFSAWGHISDKIGIKNTLIIMLSVSGVLCHSAYFTAMVGKWLYMTNILLLGFFLPPVFSILLVANCKLFGKTHYSTNVSLVTVFSIFSNFVNPLLFQVLLRIGWYCVLCYAGAVSTAALCVTIVALPRM